jgi:hypothetical protein
LRRFFTEYFHDFPLLNLIKRPLLPVNTEKSDKKSSGEHIVEEPTKVKVSLWTALQDDFRQALLETL